MAERRMFTKKITESDAFLDMPSSTQMLYFHLSMNADDDGFVNNPKKIQRMCGASDDDFKLLIAKSFVIIFDTGIIVIKHWKMHNYIQSDRYKQTDYIEELSLLGLKQNKAYTMDENKMVTHCIQNVSICKDSIGKDRIEEDIVMEEQKKPRANMLESLLPEYMISDYLLEYVQDWISYKKERGFSYKERGMRTLLKTISEKSLQYGDNEVANTISESISSGYQGIVWDKLLRGSRQQTSKKTDWGNV